MLTAGDIAGVIVATPNFYGILEDYTGLADMVHSAKALLIMTAPASALGVIKSPGNGELTLQQAKHSRWECHLILAVHILVTCAAPRH